MINKKVAEELAVQFARAAKAKAQPGEHVYIEYSDKVSRKIAFACEAHFQKMGFSTYLADIGAVYTKMRRNMTAKEIETYYADKLKMLETSQFVLLLGDNLPAFSFKTKKKLIAANKGANDIRKFYLGHDTWLYTQVPNRDFAKACAKPLKEFEAFYRQAALADYDAMAGAAIPLKEILDKGNDVRIVSPQQNTDLTFSIAGMTSIICAGEVNIPDGECFTAPIKDSVNGYVTFGASTYEHKKFQKIELLVKNGKIEHALAEDDLHTEWLNQILDYDEGSRFFGEFAINFNPYIREPMGDILFDEKIDGGFHMAAGAAYKVADNGNKSENHWDMVQIQRPEYGGGEIYIDGRLIRKDGLFVVPELAGLNPDALKKSSRPGF